LVLATSYLAASYMVASYTVSNVANTTRVAVRPAPPPEGGPQRR